MACLGLSKDACEEILTYLRTKLPQVEDALLQELAGNFMYTAPADVDPNEILELLDVPGQKTTLRGSIKNEWEGALNWKTIFPKWSLESRELRTVASALMIIKTPPRQPFRFLNALIDLLGAETHPAALLRIAVYEDMSLGSETGVLLVLSGVGTSIDILDARWTEMQTRPKIDVDVEMDLPAFLRKP